MLALTCAQYNGKWYIYSTSSYLNEAAREYNMNHRWGLLQLDE